MSSLNIKKYEREKFYEIYSQITPIITEAQQIILDIIKEKSLKLSLKNSDKNNDKTDKHPKLNSNSNFWRKVKPSLIPKDITEEEKLKNNITCLLNKLSPTNFENISKKIIDIIDTDYSIIEHCVNEIFLKAVYQPVYCPYYVKMLLKFSEKHYEIDSILAEMCEKFTNIINNSNSKKNNNETYDEFCDSNKIKQYKIGYSQFIGELYNKQLIVYEIIEIFIEELIDNIFTLYKENIEDFNIENNINSLCKLIRTCYDKNKDIMKNKDRYNKIYELNLCKKLKFKIQDIIELK